MQKIKLCRFSKLLVLLAAMSLVPALSFADAGCEVVVNAEARMVADQPAPEKKDETPKGMLLFFLNPNGKPCQMQSRILNENLAEIEKHVRIQAISTTVPSHRQYFYQLGIRQLPSLVLLDATGNIVHRFSPGIHPGTSILSAVERLGKP